MMDNPNEASNSIEVSTSHIIKSYDEQVATLNRELVMVKAALLQVQDELEIYRLQEEYRQKQKAKDEEQAELED